MSPPLTYRHPKVQRLRRLLARKTARDAEGVLVVEGAKLLAEAMAAGVRIESVYVAPGGSTGPAQAVVSAAYDRGAPVHELAPEVLERIAGTVTPQPVLAVVGAVDVALDALRSADLLVVCVDVRDPGNMGTLLRSAEASGAAGVVCCDGSVDIYNPKTVRASAGSIFHVRVVNGGEPVAVLDQLGEWGMQRLGAAARAGAVYTEADLTAPTAFVLGNEAAGLDDELDSSLDGRIQIPMSGRGESLNVGVAAAVLCFEAARQRRERS